MSIHMAQIDSRAVNYQSGASDADEAEYDRLRALAREEAQKRDSSLSRAKAAYSSGDKALAHTLSTEGKRHGAQMQSYNAQARDFIFRANNGHLPGDTIDLHGLFVEEAVEILEGRLTAAKGRGEDHLHVIVGKGNHSVNHVAKLKPAVENLCRKHGLQFDQDEGNGGRLYVRLKEHDSGAGEADTGRPTGGYPGHHRNQRQPEVPPEIPLQVPAQRPPQQLPDVPSLFARFRACCIIM
ncbi:hypothetical protein RUND412_000874 [Rhizina undulata]